MSHLTLNLKIIFEDTLDPAEPEDIVSKFDAHLALLLDLGFLDSYGTVYDYELEIGEFDADDSA